MTVTLAVPVTPPLTACTVALPVVAGAVYRPLDDTLPTPPDASDQLKLGWVVSVLPNWSFAEALNCSVAFSATEAEEGLTEIVVTV